MQCAGCIWMSAMAIGRHVKGHISSATMCVACRTQTQRRRSLAGSPSREGDGAHQVVVGSKKRVDCAAPTTILRGRTEEIYASNTYFSVIITANGPLRCAHQAAPAKTARLAAAWPGGSDRVALQGRAGHKISKHDA